MKDTFRKAPLVEIIVDLRWAEPPIVPGGVPVQAFPLLLGGGQADEFMMRFGGAAYSLGFQRSERVIPAGFPLMLGNPVYRYRPHDEASHDLMQSALLQIGPGLFSANAVPPYSSWNEFAPTVQKGIEALLHTRSEQERALPFSTVSLRYIDAFTADFRGGNGVQEFIRDVLGFAVTLPEPVLKHRRDKAEPKVHLQVSLPIASQMTMNLVVGEGFAAGGEAAVMMDCQVRADDLIDPEIGAIMKTLNEARAVIHDSFWKMTEKIHGVMGPVGEAPHVS